MNNRSSCSRAPKPRLIALSLALAAAGGLFLTPQAAASGEAPGWMHALVSVPLPPHDEKTEAVVLYSERIVTVQSADKINIVVREAYRILRPEGRSYGTIAIPYDTRSRKLKNIRAWSIPAQGHDYEVRDKDAAETSYTPGELITDVRVRRLQIPAADPGNVIGYEYEEEKQPYVLQDVWYFQQGLPVREAHYTLQLPVGWEHKATCLNGAEVKPLQTGTQLQWVVTGVKGVRHEELMPPWQGVAGHLVVSFFPASGATPAKMFSDWRQMGIWYSALYRGRKDASAEIKEKTKALTANASTPLEQMRAVAKYVQGDIRYVAIELGIGGWQPHAAPEVYNHHYGDCKDKATLMASMLQQANIDSYPVLVNTHRGAVTPEVQAYLGAFNHAILAIKLPEGVEDDSLRATVQHSRLGKLLIFDPTAELVPLGEIPGNLEANYGLLVTPESGDLIELPVLPAGMNGIQRTARLKLDLQGTLEGNIVEVRRGDRAREQRAELLRVSTDADKIKPIETLLSRSLGTFQVTSVSVDNLQLTDRPFGYKYSFVAPNYAKNAGGLVLLRPRVVGQKSSALLETKETRQLPVAFHAPLRDTDVFEITLPQGYGVDDLPAPVDLDYSFAAYHSKSEVVGNVLRYTRTFEIKELIVPVSKVEDLKKFYRVIASDERSTAVLKPAR